MKVSVITVCKDIEKTIERTIKSVIYQTYKNIEYIVIDGNSSDNTIAIINKYRDEISYFISEPDDGIYSAMNKGILKSSGDYCIFLNGDDYFYNNEVVEKVFQDYITQDIIYGDALYTFKNNTVLYKHPANLTYYFLYSSGICHQAQFIKRELFSKYGLYDEKYKLSADYEFFLRIVIKNGGTTLYIPHVICIFNAVETITIKMMSKGVLTLEREAIHRLYFSPKVLELLEEHHKLMTSDIIRLSKKLSQYLITRKFMQIFLKIFKSINYLLRFLI